MTADVLFEETQQFRSLPLWLGFVVIVAIAIGSAVFVAQRRGTAGRKLVLLPSAFATMVVLVVGALLWTSRLETRVRPSGIDVQFAPFQRMPRHIDWKDVRDVRSATIRPIRDYGGWGIRWRGNSVAYLVSGDRCLQITRRDGSTLCVGTQKPSELESAVTRARAQAAR